jgi:hypothetical protein
VSPSMSLLTGVAVTVFVRFGEAGVRPTVAVGGVFATVTGADVTEALGSMPSFAIAETVITSPWSPSPAIERSRVGPVWPTIGLPFLNHW